MHGLEIGVGLASEPRQRWRRRERLGKGRFDAIAEGCRACGERDAIEEITPRDCRCMPSRRSSERPPMSLPGLPAPYAALSYCQKAQGANL